MMMYVDVVAECSVCCEEGIGVKRPFYADALFTTLPRKEIVEPFFNMLN